MRSSPPSSGQINFKDAGSPLQLRVSAGGSKTFYVVLGQGRRQTIGRFGEVTLAQARDAARRLKAEKTLGRFLPVATSLAETRTAYLASLTIRPSTKSYYERNLGRLKASRLSDITPRDINRILDELNPTSKLQALRSYSAFFNWCIRRHYLDTSPCARMTAAQTPSRSRVLSDEELARIWKACECNNTLPDATVASARFVERRNGTPLDSTPRLPASFATIVKLLILTGQRRGEIAALQSSWITSQPLTNQQITERKYDQPICITIPASISKNGRQHSFPLGPLGTTIISTGVSAHYSGLLFPARGSNTKPFNGWSKSKAALDRISGVTGWTLHDCRRSHASRMASLGVRLEVIEKLLNHVSVSFSGVAGIYQRYNFLDEMKSAVELYEKHIRSIVS
jgi:integrase